MEPATGLALVQAAYGVAIAVFLCLMFGVALAASLYLRD